MSKARRAVRPRNGRRPCAALPGKDCRNCSTMIGTVCSAAPAVINSVFSQLREKVGEPYKPFPFEGFVFLEGGVSGWGTICGSNAGANIVSNLIIGPRIADSSDGMLMGSEIMQWYSDASMPIYTPKDPKVRTELPKTISNSPLCHISVGKWMKAASKDLQSPERKDRCEPGYGKRGLSPCRAFKSMAGQEVQTTGAIPAKTYAINTQHNCNSNAMVQMCRLLFMRRNNNFNC